MQEKRAMIRKETPLSEIKKLAPPCCCNECNHGCRMGSGLLAEGDMKRLAAFLCVDEKRLKEKYLESTELFNKPCWKPKVERKGKPYGRCTFYDEKEGCTVHEAKPLQCRISMGCRDYGEELVAWFVLNHVVNKNDPESLRQYDSYARSGGKIIPGGEITCLIKDKKMRDKILSYKLLK